MDISDQTISVSPDSSEMAPSSSPQNEEVRHERGGIEKTDWLIIALLVGIILFYFRSLIWTDTFIYGELDIRRSIYLFKTVAFEQMQHGHAPLWMPYIYCGMPLLGSFLATPFYPTDLVFALARVPLNMAFNWDLLIHLIAAQVFSYLFFKRLLKNWMGSIFCSMWFWNIFFLNSITIGDALNIRAMLLVPMAFYFVEAAFGENGRSRHFLFLSLALTLQILSGGVQFAFYTLVAATGYAAFLLVFYPRPAKERLSLSLGFSLAIAVALMIAAVQLAPQWEFSRLSLRAIKYDWFRVWGIQPHQLLDYLFSSSEELGYFGIVPLVLAVFSLVFWNDRKKYFFVALGLVATLYALGGSTRISVLLADLPLLRDFRGPFRGAIFLNFSAFALAGGALISANRGYRSRSKLILFCALSILIIAGFWFAEDAARLLLQVKQTEVLFSFIMMLLSIPALYLLFFSNRFTQAAAIFFLAALAFDIGFHYGASFSPARVSELFSKDSTVCYLEENLGTARIAVFNTAEANYFGLFGIESANGHHPFPLLRYAEALPLLESKPSLLSLAGVMFSVHFKSNGKIAPAHPPIANENMVSIQRALLKPLPKAFLVNRFRLARAPEDALEALKGDFDPSAEVILEKDPGPLALASDDDPDKQAKLLSRAPDTVVVETSSSSDALLVLSDTFYPGWRVKVDGHDAEALRADYVFRAVRVPAGNHKVEFEFKPASFLVGLAFSIIGGSVWILCGILLMRKRGRRLNQKLVSPLQ